MIKAVKNLTLVAALVAFSVAAQTPTPTPAEANARTTAASQVELGARWDTFGQNAPTASPPAPNETRLLFFRPLASANPQDAADVFVNNRLLSALLPGGFAEMTVCPGPLVVDLRGHTSRGPVRMNEPFALSARAGQIQYIETNASPAVTPLREVSLSQATPSLRALRQQTHAISRLPQSGACPALPVVTQPVPPQPVAPQRYTLSSELLFRFGGSRTQDLSNVGAAEVAKLARTIRDQHAQIDRVSVVGHTDPLGSRALNQRLSLERAQTIREILVDSGLPAAVVNAQGVADSELVVRNCAQQTRNRTELLACNQPNRRVEVVVEGTVR